jgi:hypothetical protein
MEIQCGSAIIEECQGVTVPYTDYGFQKFVLEANYVATGAISIGFQMFSSNLSENQMLALNAIRCAIVSGGDTVWFFIASGWWAFYFFGENGMIEDLLNQAYPYICTCKEDYKSIATLFGGSEESEKLFSSCSEKAALSEE